MQWDAARLAALPAVNALMRNRLSWNIGSRTDFSITANAREQNEPADKQAVHRRTRPAHGVPVVRLDAVGDRDQHGAKAEGEGDVAPPVDTAGLPFAVVAKLAVGPHRSENTPPAR